MSHELRQLSYAALAAGARQACIAPCDHTGYFSSFDQNLIDGLPLESIVGDLASGAGKELDGKLCAAHSSAALVVNTFGPWRRDPRMLRIGGVTGFETMRFEARCPTGLGGTPPHLDLLAYGDSPVAIESKCTEWMEPKPAQFSASYDRLRATHGHSPWFAQIEQLRMNPTRYQYVDAAQLVKHALGLMSCFGERTVRLIYLYWEPRNRADWPECRTHREEAEDLASRAAGSSISLIPMSYHDLWAEWDRPNPPAHPALLRLRYDREV
jgi:hypothetical protein